MNHKFQSSFRQQQKSFIVNSTTILKICEISLNYFKQGPVLKVFKIVIIFVAIFVLKLYLIGIFKFTVYISDCYIRDCLY